MTISDMWGTVVMILAVLFTTAWWYNRKHLSYWSDRGVYSPPADWFTGHFKYFVSTKLKRHAFVHEVTYKYSFIDNSIMKIYATFNQYLVQVNRKFMK